MKTMPTRIQIVEYWLEEHSTFRSLVWDEPGCFACGGGSKTRHVSPQAGWMNAGLERCHLIPKRSGGTLESSNIVLLCGRCHEHAPMLGFSAQPMIDWINRQESEVEFISVRIMAECASLDSGLFGRLNEANVTTADIMTTLGAMDAYPHPGGSSISTIAAALQVIDKFSGQILQNT